MPYQRIRIHDRIYIAVKTSLWESVYDGNDCYKRVDWLFMGSVAVPEVISDSVSLHFHQRGGHREMTYKAIRGTELNCIKAILEALDRFEGRDYWVVDGCLYDLSGKSNDLYYEVGRGTDNVVYGNIFRAGYSAHRHLT